MADSSSPFSCPLRSSYPLCSLSDSPMMKIATLQLWCYRYNQEHACCIRFYAVKASNALCGASLPRTQGTDASELMLLVRTSTYYYWVPSSSALKMLFVAL